MQVELVLFYKVDAERILMFEQLKTDKDLDKELSTWHDRTSADWVRNYYRQEAIKYLKSDKSNFCSREEMEGAKRWIKDFFNITEDDFK